MALTITLDVGMPQKVFKRRICTGSILFDTSYPTGGEPVTPATFGFHKYLDSVEIVGGGKGYQVGFDKANSTLKVVAPSWGQRILNHEQAVVSLIGAAADVTVFHVTRPTYVVGLLSVVTTLLATDTAVPVMSVEKRDPDGAAAAVELAEITYVTADGVGELDSYTTSGGAVGGGTTTGAALATPYLVPAGYTIVLVHKTQGTDAGAAAGESKCHIAIADYDADLELDDTFNLSGLTVVRFLAYGY